MGWACNMDGVAIGDVAEASNEERYRVQPFMEMQLCLQDKEPCKI